jgi:hypothetical protein
LVGPATTEVPDNAGTHGARFIRWAVLAIVAVLVLAGVLLLLPRIVHDRVVSSAREAGIELTIDRVGIGIGGIALKGITARAQRIPGGELHADEIYSVGFSGREVRVQGAELKLTGHASEVIPTILAFYEQNRSRIAGGSEPRRISIVSARVGWTGVVGEGSRLDAGEVGTELESRSLGSEDLRSTLGHFEVKTKRTTFGPWTGSLERNPTTSRLRLLFDPPVPDGPSALAVWANGLPPKVTVRIPRSPVARLGFHPNELGLPGDASTEVEVKLELGQSPSMRYETSGRLDAYGLRLKGVKGAVDVKVEGAASGMPGRPLELERTAVTIGPFVANVTGNINATDTGFRVDASWRTVPISCEKLARAEARTMGPIVAAIQDLAHLTGAARVTGTANASGIVKYDTKNPDEVTSTMGTHETCGLTIFGL